MRTVKEEIEFKLIDDFSKKGTPIKYINFADSTFRLSDEQKDILKSICQGYFFYSKSKKMWGFTHRENNEINTCNYLKEGIIPDNIVKQKVSRIIGTRKELIPFNIADFEIKFIELKGRPLYYYENIEGIIEIYINLTHWFFEKHDASEKELAKKMVLSLIVTKLEFTSQLIENYFVKLNSIQENMKYNYGKRK